MNILILSVGTRNKIVQYFKAALTDREGNRTGRVIATDMSPIAPAVYEADVAYEVPCMTDPGYLDVIFDICKSESVDAVLSLIDPELSLLAQHEEEFKALGTTVVGSSYELCEMSLDKLAFSDFCNEHNFPCARSFATLDTFDAAYQTGEIAFPVFVKPYRGSASKSIARIDTYEALRALFEQDPHADDLMIQEYMSGSEFGVDCYIDLVSGEPVSLFIKKKLLMRAGETDKSVSFKDEQLKQLVLDFVETAGYRGQIDIDVFEKNGSYYLSEVNPRFGGGYPHAYECGVDHMKLIVNNINGVANEAKFDNYDEGLYMMKYNEIALVQL